MPVYTIHAPRHAGLDTSAGADRFVFVRDGFHFWAFVAGLVWLVWYRLWWALLGYIAISIVGEVVLSALGAGAGTRFAVMVLFALLMGFEASSLRRWTLSRGNWRQVDVIVGDNRETAERRFFDRWAAARAGGFDDAVDRGGPPPTRVAASPYARPPSGSHESIIGLFPQPGAPR
ncbi:MAG: DUF2628 domain-containing protein [Tardiphaga sp.]